MLQTEQACLRYAKPGPLAPMELLLYRPVTPEYPEKGRLENGKMPNEPRWVST